MNGIGMIFKNVLTRLILYRYILILIKLVVKLFHSDETYFLLNK